MGIARRPAPRPLIWIVYVDNDPLVLAFARALLTSDPRGATAFLDADLRDPGKILTDNTLTDTLDLTQPVALLLVAILHFLADTQQAHGIVHTLTDALPAGSLLVITHATTDLLDPGTARTLDTIDVPGRGDFTARTRTQVEHFLDGLDLVPPGLTVISDWRPDPDTTAPQQQDVSVYGAVARKR